MKGLNCYLWTDSAIWNYIDHPDVIWEVKSGGYICDTGNLKTMLDLATMDPNKKIPVNLIVKQGAKVSGPLENRIAVTGGTIYRYNVQTGEIIPPLL